MKKVFILLALLILFIPSLAQAGTIEPKVWDLLQKLAAESTTYDAYAKFASMEAKACHLIIRTGTLDANTAGQHTHWTATCTREIVINNTDWSTWEAVNAQNLIHELTHAGAGGGSTGEIASRKAEAACWKLASTKPGRGSGQDSGCWATYDMVYNADGTQRSHNETKTRLKAFGYAQGKM